MFKREYDNGQIRGSQVDSAIRNFYKDRVIDLDPSKFTKEEIDELIEEIFQPFSRRIRRDLDILSSPIKKFFSMFQN